MKEKEDWADIVQARDGMQTEGGGERTEELECCGYHGMKRKHGVSSLSSTGGRTGSSFRRCGEA